MVKHSNDISEVMGSNPVQAWIFSGFLVAAEVSSVHNCNVLARSNIIEDFAQSEIDVSEIMNPAAKSKYGEIPCSRICQNMIITFNFREADGMLQDSELWEAEPRESEAAREMN